MVWSRFYCSFTIERTECVNDWWLTMAQKILFFKACISDLFLQQLTLITDHALSFMHLAHELWWLAVAPSAVSKLKSSHSCTASIEGAAGLDAHRK